MPLTSCFAHMNTEVLKFNWEFYVTCRWQETYYSLSNTCRPPRSSSIQPGALNKSAAWCACIIQHFHGKWLVKSECFPPVSIAQLSTFCILQRYAKRFSQRCTSWYVFLPDRINNSLFTVHGMARSRSLNVNKVLYFEQCTSDIKSTLFYWLLQAAYFLRGNEVWSLWWSSAGDEMPF